MTESSLYPGSQQCAPMKYGNKPSDSQVLSSWESGDWIAQEKKDGAWYQLEITDEGNIFLFGRTESKVTGEYTQKIENVPHIKEWAEQLPHGTTLVGEIYVPGGKSNDVTKIMGCTAENAYKRQFNSSAYGGPIHYYVFDCIRYSGTDLCDVPFIKRYEYYLQSTLKNLFNSEYVELADCYYDNFEEHLNNIFAAGGEGMVFKKKDCPYRPGKRTTTSQAYKYKEHMDSIDLVCMSLEEPTMEYTGKELDTWQYWYTDAKTLKNIPVTKPFFFKWKNAMRLGAYKDGKLIEVCRVASGLTDENREDMGLHPENWINKVIEIECMSLTKDNCVRHPVFKKIREDKDPQDCLWDEIFK